MIIGFAGLAGAGKNEAARALPYPSIGFADSIKDIITSIDPVISFHPVSGMIHLSNLLKYESFELVKRNSRELRRLLQELGMAMRNINEEFWVDQVWAQVSRSQFEDNACITDVRFLNEISFIKREFMFPGYTIWIERPGVEQGAHASENSITAEDCDGFVLNDGTIEQLHERVRAELLALQAMRLGK
jgi:hypothetical protein